MTSTLATTRICIFRYYETKLRLGTTYIVIETKLMVIKKNLAFLKLH